MARMLAEGDVAGRWTDRSPMALALTLAAVNAGWTRTETVTALVDPGNVGGGHVQARRLSGRHGAGLRARPAHDQDRLVGVLWERAVVRFLTAPAAGETPEVVAELAAVRQAAHDRPYLWGGQGGPSELLVLEALLDVAVEAVTATPTASTRQLAERTPVVHQTVSRALARLERAGWVELVEAPVGTLAGRFRVRIPAGLPAAAGVEAVADRVGELPAPRWSSTGAHDVWVWHGLGRVAGRVYDQLTGAAPLGLRTLAARTGLHPATVSRHLRRLAAHGLARTGIHGWTRGGATLDRVAEVLEVAGTLDRRAARHAVEREAFGVFHADFTARAGYAVQRGLYRPDAPHLPYGTTPPPGRHAPPQAA